MGINEERLKEIIGAGKLWCGDPETQEMARQLLAYRDSGALEALKNLNGRVRYWAENPRPDEWILQEWVRILDDLVAKLEAVGE